MNEEKALQEFIEKNFVTTPTLEEVLKELIKKIAG